MMKHKLRLTVALTVSLALGNSFLWAIPARASREIAPALDQTGSEMRDVIENYNTDRGSLIRTYPDALSPVRRARLKQFYEQWRDNLTKLNFDAMGEDGRVDYLLFKNHLDHELRQLEIQTKQWAEIEPFVPFAKAVFELDETRRRMAPADSPKVAALLTDVSKQIEELRRAIGTGPSRTVDNAETKPTAELRTPRAGSLSVKKNVANRAAASISSLRNTLRNWRS